MQDDFFNRFSDRDADEVEPFVGFPNEPFRIRERRVSPLVYLSNQFRQGGWYLVDASIKSNIQLSNLWRGRLYEGVTISGQPFLIPATLAGSPDYYSWEDSLQGMLEIGTKNWITHNSERNRRGHIATVETRLVLREPEWWTGSFAELVAAAFGERVIYAKYLQRKTVRRPAYEDVEES